MHKVSLLEKILFVVFGIMSIIGVGMQLYFLMFKETIPLYMEYFIPIWMIVCPWAFIRKPLTRDTEPSSCKKVPHIPWPPYTKERL